MAFFMLLIAADAGRPEESDRRRQEQKEARDKKFKSPEFEQARLDVEAFEDWEQGTIPWVDEFYEISARFPWQPVGFHLTKLDGSIVPRRNPKEKERYQARIALFCIDPAPGQCEKFQDGLVSEHIQVQPVRVDGNKFTINLEMSYQQAKNYLVQLVLPPEMLTRITESLKQKK